MRFSVCGTGDLKRRVNMDVHKDEILKREIEIAMNEGHVCSVALKKIKRFRSAFTTEQVNYLENEFRKYPYVGNARRKDVATALSIPERAVKIWFQNRRMKEKKDTSTKEPDRGKAVVINDAFNVRAGPSTNSNEESLPLLSAQVSNIIASDAKTIGINNLARDITCKSDSITKPIPYDSPSVIINRMTNTQHFVSGPKIEKKEDETKIRAAESTVNDHIQLDSPINYVQYKAEQQNFSYILPSTSSPEDLSSKAKQISLSSQPAPEVKSNEIPVYLKGYYAQPYLPPSNMVWRPVNVPPIIPTSVNLVPCPGSPQPIMRSNCSCDCHIKPYPTPPLLLQNSPGPNLQYVVAAMPFQNASPKY